MNNKVNVELLLMTYFFRTSFKCGIFFENLYGKDVSIDNYLHNSEF